MKSVGMMTAYDLKLLVNLVSLWLGFGVRGTLNTDSVVVAIEGQSHWSPPKEIKDFLLKMTVDGTTHTGTLTARPDPILATGR